MRYALAALLFVACRPRRWRTRAMTMRSSAAMPLLKLHFEADELENAGVDDTVRQLPPIKALKGSGKFDVLEVWGHIYKADYRMRFIYAQIPDSCVLMGQEILEASDPY